VKAEAVQYIRFVTAGDVEHAAALPPADQADRQRSLEQRRAKHARDMRPALTPVEARTAVDPFVAPRSVKLDTGGEQRDPTRLRHRGAVYSQIDDAQPNEPIGDRNAEFASDMLVTRARPAQRPIDPRCCPGRE